MLGEGQSLKLAEEKRSVMLWLRKIHILCVDKNSSILSLSDTCGFSVLSVVNFQEKLYIFVKKFEILPFKLSLTKNFFQIIKSATESMQTLTKIINKTLAWVPNIFCLKSQIEGHRGRLRKNFLSMKICYW